MKTSNDHYQDLFEEIRLLHNRLRWLGDQVHEKVGQTSAKRSLLFSLYREGACTVPDLARERLVSRQIIQTQINLLLDEGLVASQINPRHKRSKQMVLTKKGRLLVEKMLEKESKLLSAAGSPLANESLAEMVEHLKTIRVHLENSNIQS
ncbi:MarR family winged helix-turn-helix transcriptional regulator [Kiritimatiellota bacterium B12222]|nr:MarR family winged helix-turn-helix transcriptional regulator [Kiritimatiellota bacterium B12222]